jgi:hypothetical protein
MYFLLLKVALAIEYFKKMYWSSAESVKKEYF